MKIAAIQVPRGCKKMWKKVAPFFTNPRGVLTHRVKAGTTFLNHDGSLRHWHVWYWCGNGANGHGVDGWKFPPDPEAVVCAFCEAMAIKAGQPSSDTIVGRHVHIGGVKAFRTCCMDNNEKTVNETV